MSYFSLLLLSFINNAWKWQKQRKSVIPLSVEIKSVPTFYSILSCKKHESVKIFRLILYLWAKSIKDNIFMKLRLFHFIIFLGCACGQVSYAAEAETAVVQSTEQKYSATFGENTVYFTTQNAQEQFVKMVKKYRAYQQYSENISVNLMNTLKETRTELGQAKEAATNDKGCNTQRAASYLTKLKNQLKDMFEASENMRKAYDQVSQVEVALSGMNISNDDTGERNRYWEECKDAFNNCIDAIKEARNEVDLKRDEYFVQINNIIESKK